MRFVKYHGLGNDFIVLDPAVVLTPELALRLCRRGFSIGADGVMRVLPAAATADADVAMDLVNSDGSLPEMCGNGIRCLVKHAVDTLGFTQNPLRVATPHGVLACHWSADASGVASVRVAMGRPRFAAAEIPLDLAHVATADGALVDLEIDGRRFTGVPVNTGNPHFAIFGDAARATALTWGPRLELHPAFPAKANIEFVEVLETGGADLPARLRVTVWERGCGLTQACGTGATASATAARRLGLVAAGVPVHVELPGGTLVITLAPDFAAAFMEGPVAFAFSGDVTD